MTRPHECSRRAFVARSASFVAKAAGLSAAIGLPSDRRAGRGWRRQERFPVVASEPWGRLLRVSDGVWALASDPLRDRTTLCNGGIVAGRAGVVVVEAFGSEAGARWMAEQAERLTGRTPTHVVVSHHHGDHTAGLTGLVSGFRPRILVTETTRRSVLERDGGAAADVLSDVEALDGRRPTELDLGERSLILVPRRGHTESDLTVEIPEQRIVFCGDLVWNEMFPNYVDAIPSRLTQTVRLMRAAGAETYVTGHGPLADGPAVDRYLALLDDVEAAARRALEQGRSAEEAGASYRLPAGLEAWTLFNPGYFGRAIGAWMEELRSG